MGGLLAYLVGPGRSNEHTDPHLVAGGDGWLMAWFDDSQLDGAAGQQVARHLDAPRTAFGVEVKGGHVWHCSLSIAAREGELGDEKWREVVEAFVDRMGFGDHDGTKAPTRWAAVHHGTSKEGNDHVHLVVNLVREDGTRASIHNDRIQARAACRELEQRFGLEPLENASYDRAEVRYQPGEREAAGRRMARAEFEKARRAGVEPRTWASVPAAEREARIEAATKADQPRWELARKVRACATASRDEGEFVRRMRQHGVLVRPRFAAGATDVIAGYSVAIRPSAGERPIWYGGGRLAKDLTLPRLREEWESTPHSAQTAADEWSAAMRGRRPVHVGREQSSPDTLVCESAAQELTQLREKLRQVPVDDHETWARVARGAAGSLAAWSLRVEPVPGPLAGASDALAKSAHTVRAGRPKVKGLPSLSGTAFVLLAAATSHGAAAQLVILRQLANLAKAIHDRHQAEGAARRASGIATAARGDLARVAAVLEQYVAREAPVPEVGWTTREPTATVEQSKQLTSPVPTTLGEQDRRTAAAAAVAGRKGVER